MVSGLLSVTVGYNVKEINTEIIKQINKGISFSLATKLEYELAKKIIRHVPCAEMVRYAKNGSDVTTAAIRLARYNKAYKYNVLWLSWMARLVHWFNIYECRC